MRIVLLVLLLISPVSAWELYARGRPVQAKVHPGFKVALEPILEGLGVSWEREGSDIKIVGQPGGGPSLSARDRLFYENRRVRLSLESHEQRVLVPLGEVAELLGCRLEIERELGTIDLWEPKLLAQAGRQTVVSDGREAGATLALQNFSYGRKGARLLGYAVVTNRGSSDLTDVVVWVRVRSDDTVLGQFGKRFERLEAGQTATFQFPAFEVDPQLSVQPQIELRYRR